MAAEKIKCKETKVPCTKELNNRDYLLDMLETIKNITVNTSIALNESSNEKLYHEILEIFDEMSFLQRDVYEFTFSKGWYVLETCKESKIKETIDNLSDKITELSK